MRKTFKYLLLILTAIFFACQKEQQNIVEKEINLSYFKNIEMQSPFDVYLIQGNSFSIRFVAAKKMIEQLEYELSDSTIRIKNNNKLKWFSPKAARPSVYITCDQPRQINLKETCHLRTLNAITSPDFILICGRKLNMADLELNCNKFGYWNNFPCGGRINLKGICNHINVWNSALMGLDAEYLTTQTASIINASKADCNIQVTNYLEYTITGEGNINLFGNPNQIIEKEVSGKGRLIRK